MPLAPSPPSGGEGRGEGAAPPVMTSRLLRWPHLSAPHPNPLPARAGRGSAGAVHESESAAALRHCHPPAAPPRYATRITPAREDTHVTPGRAAAAPRPGGADLRARLLDGGAAGAG